MMNFKNKIVRDPDICGGEPVIKGTRVTLRIRNGGNSSNVRVKPMSS